MPAMVTVSIAENAQMRRLVEFAGDVAQLSGKRHDAELLELVDDLHTDLLTLRADDDE